MSPDMLKYVSRTRGVHIMMTSGIQNSLSTACLPSIGRRAGGFVVGEVSGLECSLDVKFYYNNLLPST